MPITENLVKINRLRKEWDGLQPLSKEANSKLWEKFRLEWNYNSNHIEGNTLTYGETQLLLIFDKTTGNHELREYEEMQAHDVAIKMVREWASDKIRDLTEADIRNLNKVILVKPFWKEALTYDGQATRRLIKVGEYKEHPNSVRLKTGEMFHYASPQETPSLMAELVAWYRNNEIQHPLVLAAELHYRFIRIHPFDDGNGRIARLLVNYVLMKNGYPPVIVKSADKENYLTALQRADTGDIAAFHDYMAIQLIWSLELADKAAHGGNIEEPDDVDKEISVWKKQFNGNRKGVMPRTDSQVNELYQKGFKQMFELFISKHKQFEDMFSSVRILGYVNGGNSDNKGLEHIEEKMSKWKEAQRIKFTVEGEAPKRSEEGNFNQLMVHIQLNGFANDGTNTFSEVSTLRIEFHPYVYTIFHNNNRLRENLYSDFIDTESAKRMVSDAVKNVFDGIKKQIRPK